MSYNKWFYVLNFKIYYMLVILEWDLFGIMCGNLYVLVIMVICDVGSHY